ncbi:MAG: permease-like cell division protein FtsX [Candidatus Gastranaerophilales bacterium]|nr:permease-like cell division protein FtsX [Candidatus Gastranaerophilales bacterium]
MSSNKQTIKKQVKKHIPKDWLTELRIVYRITMETLNDIKRTGIVNIIIITTIAAILTIFGGLFRTALSVNSFAHELGNVLEISVYLKQNADAQTVANRIKKIEHVQKVRIIPKENSWQDLKREIDIPDIENPLPDTLHVKVDKPQNINSVFNNIKVLSVVSDMSYAQELAKKIQILNNVVNTSTVLVVIIVAILTITIINNTIQLVIQSRKDEIEIMRLMGVSNWYIKIPLIMQGALYGFLGAAFALIPLNVVQNMLNNVHRFFMIPGPIFAGNMVVIAMFFLGISFGAGGSFLSIKKHLQV